jgi:hypothetical protein
MNIIILKISLIVLKIMSSSDSGSYITRTKILVCNLPTQCWDSASILKKEKHLKLFKEGLKFGVSLLAITTSNLRPERKMTHIKSGYGHNGL